MREFESNEWIYQCDSWENRFKSCGYSDKTTLQTIHGSKTAGSRTEKTSIYFIFSSLNITFNRNSNNFSVVESNPTNRASFELYKKQWWEFASWCKRYDIWFWAAIQSNYRWQISNAQNTQTKNYQYQERIQRKGFGIARWKIGQKHNIVGKNWTISANLQKALLRWWWYDWCKRTPGESNSIRWKIVQGCTKKSIEISSSTDAWMVFFIGNVNKCEGFTNKTEVIRRIEWKTRDGHLDYRAA